MMNEMMLFKGLLYTHDKHEEGSALYIIWKLQIKTTRRYHYTSIRPKSKTPTPPNAGKDVEQKEVSYWGGNAEWYDHF